MLTATYSIVALKLEQKRAHWTFAAIQQTIRNAINNIRHASGVELENMLNRLAQFEQYCHQRKMEIFIIPALRNLTREADALLDELDSLNASSVALLQSLRTKMQVAVRQGAAMVEEFCAALEQCCAHFYQRLAREEELVRIAERVIPSEAWFSIAASFLSHDERAGRFRKVALQDDEE